MPTLPAQILSAPPIWYTYGRACCTSHSSPCLPLPHLAAIWHCSWIHFDLASKEKRIEELEMEMQAPDFWNDPERSNQKMREAKGLKDIVETIKGLERQYDDIMTLIEMGAKSVPVCARLSQISDTHKRFPR